MKKPQLSVLVSVVLLGLANACFATDESVVIVGAREDTWNCNAATTERAHWLADRATRDGDFQRAGECYLAAGDPSRANAAFIKAAGTAGADTSRKFSASAEQVKAQAKQLKLAFQHH